LSTPCLYILLQQRLEKKTENEEGRGGKILAAWDTKRQKCASVVDPARRT